MAINLIQGDCMDLMRGAKNKQWDLAICDPPFGLKDRTKNKLRRHKTSFTYTNDSIPSPEYFAELERTCKATIIWGCQYMMPFLNPEGSFVVWDKGADPDLHNMSSCDVAWYSKRSRIRLFDGHWCGAVKLDNEKTIHIHQKPVGLYRWLLTYYAQPGYKILDTHLGSGSIAIACHDYGYDLTATEIDPDYFKAAEKRLRQHQAQTKLFEVN